MRYSSKFSKLNISALLLVLVGGFLSFAHAAEPAKAAAPAMTTSAPTPAVIKADAAAGDAPPSITMVIQREESFLALVAMVQTVIAGLQPGLSWLLSILPTL